MLTTRVAAPEEVPDTDKSPERMRTVQEEDEEDYDVNGSSASGELKKIISASSEDKIEDNLQPGTMMSASEQERRTEPEGASDLEISPLQIIFARGGEEAEGAEAPTLSAFIDATGPSLEEKLQDAPNVEIFVSNENVEVAENFPESIEDAPPGYYDAHEPPSGNEFLSESSPEETKFVSASATDVDGATAPVLRDTTSASGSATEDQHQHRSSALKDSAVRGLSAGSSVQPDQTSSSSSSMTARVQHVTIELPPSDELVTTPLPKA